MKEIIMVTYTDRQLEQLWEELSDIPFDEDDCTELFLADDWFIFEASTDRETIWHWFDEHYSKGVHALMFPSEH